MEFWVCISVGLNNQGGEATAFFGSHSLVDGGGWPKAQTLHMLQSSISRVYCSGSQPSCTRSIRLIKWAASLLRAGQSCIGSASRPAHLSTAKQPTCPWSSALMTTWSNTPLASDGRVHCALDHARRLATVLSASFSRARCRCSSTCRARQAAHSHQSKSTLQQNKV
jgi:hypothetical protein